MELNDRRYYVYIHRQLRDHRVFYVGKGTGDRLFRKTAKTQEWKDIAENIGYYAVVYKDNLTENEAFDLEAELLKNPPKDWILVNKIYESQCDKSLEDVDKYFYYDETSPSSIRWKVWNKQTNHCRRDAGDIAGFINNNRWKVCINGRELMVHRVVCKLFGIESKGKVINHIDCNPLNNKMENLEVVTRKQNSRRKSNNKGIMLNSLNTSGVNGVRETQYGEEPDQLCAHASWYDPSLSKTVNKTFSYKKYGKEEAWSLAIEYRKNIIKELWKDTENE